MFTLRYGPHLETLMDEYYRECIKQLSPNANMLLDEADRSLQAITYEELHSVVENNSVLKTLHLLKVVGIMFIFTHGVSHVNSIWFENKC